MVCQHRGVPSRVLIVDDHAGFRAAAHALLEAEGFVVVGEAGDGPGAVEAVDRLRPDVVLLDVQLPGIDGFGVAELLAQGGDCPIVVLISSREAAVYGARIARSSAAGFLAKGALSGATLRQLMV